MEKRKIMPWLISGGLHVVIFIIVCLTGLFAQVSADKKPPVDVQLYEVAADEGGGGGGGGSQSTDTDTAEASAEAVSMPDNPVNLPEISEAYTQEPEKQKEYRVQHHVTQSGRAENPPKENTLASSQDGTANANGGNNGSTGTGEGAGSGFGIGSGEGSGTGDGSGSGNGSGSGAGNGDGAGTRDAEAAARPKTPPVFLGGATPAYPVDLQEQGIGGSVLLRLTVDASGSVVSAEVASSSGYRLFDNAALKAAYTYSFSPARNIYDEPVTCIITKRIIFDPQ